MKNRYIILIALCLISTLAIVLYIRSLYLQPAEEVVAFFEPTPELESLFDSSKYLQDNVVKVVYFWQKDCPCDQFIKPHFLLMMDKYRQHNIEFYLAALDGQQTSEFSHIKTFPHELLLKVKDSVKATPSVAIWNRENQLVYFGPHTLSYVCNDDTSLVKKAVDALLNGQPFNALSIAGAGCFCPLKH